MGESFSVNTNSSLCFFFRKEHQALTPSGGIWFSVAVSKVFVSRADSLPCVLESTEEDPDT